MKTIKKALYKLLCNRAVGEIVVFFFKERIPDIRWKGFCFTFKGANIPSGIIASVFWGFYESAEIRFAEKYFKGDMDVIELGGSCGVVTSHLVSKLLLGKKVISVEANADLAEVWKENAGRKNYNKEELVLLNNAIHYGTNIVSFHISNNTTESGKVNEVKGNMRIVKVPAITLNEICSRFNLTEFTLVCDIEGAEVEIFINENESLNTCRALLIELHPSEYKGTNYTYRMLEELILSKGFTLRDKEGPVYYFEKFQSDTIIKAIL